MTLLAEYGISIQKLPDVIKFVMKKLAGTTVDQLPSASTLSRMYTEARYIASKHVATKLLDGVKEDGNKRGHVLHQDATTKFHKHYEGVQATLATGEVMSMGLREVSGGDADTYFKCIEGVLDDLASTLSDREHCKAQLLSSFKAFMNDRCAVNGVLTKQIQKLREDILPTVISNFTDMTDEEKEQVTSMGHFTCRMHLLSNFATAAEKGATSFEQCIVEGANPFSFGTGSSTVNLVATCAKAFTQRGCDKSGVNSFFDSFLRGREKKNTILTYSGQRFNILFHDAAAVFYHRHDIVDFLESWPEPNKLLKCIQFDIKQPVNIAGIRALGIIGQSLTEPFQDIMKGKSFFELNPYLATAQETLKQWSQDGSRALDGAPVFPVEPQPSQLSEALFADSGDQNLDALTVIALELISLSMLILLERQASEQLPGGSMSTPSEAQMSATAHVPSSNLVSERDMAKLDNILKTKPAASVSTIETVLLWQTNKPSSWLASMPEKEREKVLEEARSKAPSWRNNMIQRKAKLIEELENKLILKQKKKSEKEQKNVEGRLLVSQNISKYGGLWDEKDVEERLSSLGSAKSKRDALMAQIKFLKIVINAVGDKTLFQESSGGKQYSVEQITDNLKKILSLNRTSPQPSCAEPSQTNYHYKDNNHRDLIVKVKRGKFETELNNDRCKRLNSKQQILLDKLVEDVSSLIGVEIERRVKVDVDYLWCVGQITGIEKMLGVKTVFNLTMESGAKICVRVLEELKNGNLILKNFL